MCSQPQCGSHDDIIKDWWTGIDEELATFGCLENAAQVTSIDPMDDDSRFFTEKVASPGRITITTRHPMALANK